MDKLTIVGEHDDRTVAQMRNCLRDDRATAGVLCADGHLGYAQPVGGVIACYDSISVSGVGFDIGCGDYAVRTDLKAADLDTKLAGGKNGIDVEPAVLETHSDLGREYLIAMDLAGSTPTRAANGSCTRLCVTSCRRASPIPFTTIITMPGKSRSATPSTMWCGRARRPLYPSQRGFVGGSMGDISVILKGKPAGMVPELLHSTIHGSGRVMSRTQAAGKSRWVKGRKVSQGGGLVDENAWRETIRKRGTILIGAGADEMPPVYRPLRDVLAAHQDTFEIETVLAPRIVVMAGSGEHDPYKD